MTHALPQIAAGSANADVSRWIMQRTGSRVHDLRVESDRGTIKVYGHAGSHYVRQLALAAAMEACDPNRVEVHIEVN
jgi:hypothetical protein